MIFFCVSRMFTCAAADVAILQMILKFIFCFIWSPKTHKNDRDWWWWWFDRQRLIVVIDVLKRLCAVTSDWVCAASIWIDFFFVLFPHNNCVLLHIDFVCFRIDLCFGWITRFFRRCGIWVSVVHLNFFLIESKQQQQQKETRHKTKCFWTIIPLPCTFVALCFRIYRHCTIFGVSNRFLNQHHRGDLLFNFNCASFVHFKTKLSFLSIVQLFAPDN